MNLSLFVSNFGERERMREERERDGERERERNIYIVFKGRAREKGIVETREGDDFG